MSIWLILALVSLIIEVLGFGQLTIIWFSIGAFLAYGAQRIGWSLTFQVSLFIISSLLLFFIFTRLIRKTETPEIKTASAAIIGQTFRLSQDLNETNLQRLNGQEYRFAPVSSEKDRPFLKGDLVKVIEVKGIHYLIAHV